MRITVACLALCLVFWSCQDPLSSPGEPILLTQGVEFSPGDSIVLRLRNNTPDQVRYNLCNAALEVQQFSGSWVTTDFGPVCTTDMRTLDPDEESSFIHHIPEDQVFGPHRFMTSVFVGESCCGLTRVWSNEFSIGS